MSPTKPHERPVFVALDFETADHGADSACAIGMVRVEHGQIVKQVSRLIRPPREWFAFTGIHGISWEDVAAEPSFAELWPELVPVIEDAGFVAAHNASFDRNVLHACCHAAGIAVPRKTWVCTVELAREQWKIYPTKLPLVCTKLGIDLNHHEALSDARACAQIVMRAQGEALGATASLGFGLGPQG